MGTLIDVRMNLSFAKDKENELIPIRQFVFITEKPSYSLTNELNVVRGRECQEHRITIVGEEAVDEFIKAIEHYRNSKSEDLK